MASLSRNAVRGRANPGGREHDERRKYAAYERDLLEADKESEVIKAELSTLECQVATLQGALTVSLSVIK